MSPTLAVRPRTSHPAKYPKYVLARLELHIRAEARRLGRPARVLDPFAGVGRIHDLPRRIASTVGVEIEPEWASCRRGTIVGDATRLSFRRGSFDVVATSPVYPNRVTDHHEAKDSCRGCQGTGVVLEAKGCDEAPWSCRSCGRVDCVCGVLAKEMLEHNRACRHCRRHICSTCGGSGLSKRYTYRHALRRMPHERSAATMTWGGKYRGLHGQAWEQARIAIAEGGLMLVNIKNHIADGAEQQVVEWHSRRLGESGFVVLTIDELTAPGLRHGANRELRTGVERLIVARAA